MSWLSEILYFIFPFFAIRSAEKTIKKNIDNIINNGQENIKKESIENVNEELLKEIYNNTFEAKKTIDDKAKIGIVGVTISTGLISSISSNYENLAIISIVLYETTAQPNLTLSLNYKPILKKYSQ